MDWQTALTTGVAGVALGLVLGQQWTGSKAIADESAKDARGCHQDCDEVKFDDLNKLNNATTRILHWMSDDAMRLTTLTHLVVDCIYDLIPCERVTVYCVDRAKDELWVAISRDIKGLRIPLGTGLVGTVAETGVAANIENCQKHDKFYSRVDKETSFQSRSMLLVPVKGSAGGEVLAVLACINRSDEDGSYENTFTAYDERVLGTFALQVGVALQKCALHGALLKILADREVAADEIMLASEAGKPNTKSPLARASKHPSLPILPSPAESLSRQPPRRGESEESTDSTRIGSPRKPLLARSISAPEAMQRTEFCVVHHSQNSLLLEFMADDMGSSPGLSTRLGLGRPSQRQSGSSSGGPFQRMVPSDGSSRPRRWSRPASTDPEEVDLLPEVVGGPEVVSPDLTWAASNVCGISFQDMMAWDLDVPNMVPNDLLHCAERLFTEALPRGSGVQPPSLADLRGFIMSIYNNYHNELPFHNFKHGFSTMQSTYKMVFDCASLRDKVSEVQRFALVLAAMCHDVGHPGVNNGYLVNSGDPIAFQHNDDAVLERYHAALTFSIAHRAGNDIFATFDTSKYREVRRTLIEAVLNTDMSRHFGLVEMMMSRAASSSWNDTVEECHRKQNEALVIKAVVHVADLSGQAQPWALANAWGDRVLKEFAIQAQAEVENELPRTPFMHGLDTEIARANLQQGFVANIVLPLWKCMAALAPEVKCFEENAKDNIRRYKQILKSAVGKESPLK
eukprot:CAMPEP_0118857736 /NCGR_PEP_ID=MMETSP1163-20130328/4702_1 /TAXON_ID=124430 /ORGANISM="Phaeomonas parva, Strain CCMP2877" /LENGTH=739 /DNA_ID=CAMNT_0006791075 /DNA_START=388 /DNA_END=2607 /DNA_ORIENTATION=-